MQCRAYSSIKLTTLSLPYFLKSVRMIFFKLIMFCLHQAVPTSTPRVSFSSVTTTLSISPTHSPTHQYTHQYTHQSSGMLVSDDLTTVSKLLLSTSTVGDEVSHPNTHHTHHNSHTSHTSHTGCVHLPRPLSHGRCICTRKHRSG